MMELPELPWSQHQPEQGAPTSGRSDLLGQNDNVPYTITSDMQTGSNFSHHDATNMEVSHPQWHVAQTTLVGSVGQDSYTANVHQGTDHRLHAIRLLPCQAGNLPATYAVNAPLSPKKNEMLDENRSARKQSLTVESDETLLLVPTFSIKQASLCKQSPPPLSSLQASLSTLVSVLDKNTGHKSGLPLEPLEDRVSAMIETNWPPTNNRDGELQCVMYPTTPSIGANGSSLTGLQSVQTLFSWPTFNPKLKDGDNNNRGSGDTGYVMLEPFEYFFSLKYCSICFNDMLNSVYDADNEEKPTVPSGVDPAFWDKLNQTEEQLTIRMAVFQAEQCLATYYSSSQ